MNRVLRDADESRKKRVLEALVQMKKIEPSRWKRAMA